MARSPARRADAPECAILTNDAALHSLKRAQLLALCKQHGVKGSGKNIDLIARLQERGRDLLEQDGAGDASRTEENADTSTASWAIVSNDSPIRIDGSPEPGEAASASGDTPLAEVGSSSSLTSTLRSAGSSLYRALVTPNPHEPTAGPAPVRIAEASSEPPSTHTGIYPSLRSFQAAYAASPNTPAGEDAPPLGIRHISRPSLATEQATSSAPSGASPFVFGSPVKERPTSASTPAFTFSMPGALFASTSSTASASDQQIQAQASAADALLEEMNRRALEAKAAAEAAGIKRSQSFAVGSSSRSSDSVPLTAGANKKAAFDVSHQRTFEKMDSIANHWAAKRKIPSTGDVVGMTRSSSARSFVKDSTDDRGAKRHKPTPASTSEAQDRASRDRQVVAALRESGWSNGAHQTTSIPFDASIRKGVSAVGRPTKSAKAQPDQDAPEQTRRKRQLELAKARRKSGGVVGVGITKRRPSLGVGPTQSRSTARRLFRSTVRKLGSTAPVPPLPPAITSAKPANERPAQSASASQPSMPRFAAPTASTASRAALTAAASPTKSARLISPLKQSARKVFDLQASLKRPITWQSHVRSPMVQASPSITRTATSVAAAAQVKRPLDTSLGTEHSSKREISAEYKLLSLPQAPTSIFSLPAPPGPATSSSGWQPPAMTRSPLLPTTPNADRKVSSRPAASSRKTVSALSRAARSEDKSRTRERVEGVEARARMIRAKTAAAKARLNPQ